MEKRTSGGITDTACSGDGSQTNQEGTPSSHYSSKCTVSNSDTRDGSKNSKESYISTTSPVPAASTDSSSTGATAARVTPASRKKAKKVTKHQMARTAKAQSSASTQAASADDPLPEPPPVLNPAMDRACPDTTASNEADLQTTSRPSASRGAVPNLSSAAFSADAMSAPLPSSTYSLPPMTAKDVPSILRTLLDTCVDWVVKIPELQMILSKDRLALLHARWHQVLLLFYCQYGLKLTDEMLTANAVSGSSSSRSKTSHHFSRLIMSFLTAAEKIRKLGMDNTEYAFLCGTVLCDVSDETQKDKKLLSSLTEVGLVAGAYRHFSDLTEAYFTFCFPAQRDDRQEAFTTALGIISGVCGDHMERVLFGRGCEGSGGEGTSVKAWIGEFFVKTERECGLEEVEDDLYELDFGPDVE